jgi:hypothetical protein
MTDLLKTSKKNLLVLTENDMRNAKRKEDFLSNFSIIFMQK